MMRNQPTSPARRILFGVARTLAFIHGFLEFTVVVIGSILKAILEVLVP
ncbi:hypothetical protein [Acetobacter nitrogenifigens]|nr:hypothetical protein [Acetobacter nitrogenifigens]